MGTRIIEGDVLPTSGSIKYDGDLLIKGSILGGSFVVATGDIKVMGRIEASTVKSFNGNIEVEEGILGIEGYTVEADGSITCTYIHSATVRSNSSIKVKDVILDSTVKAKQSVLVEGGEGIIEGGEITAGFEIVANIIGSHNRTPTTVRLVNFRQRELYDLVLKYDRKIRELQVKLDQLNKYIQIIRILGRKVVQLPLEKKRELAQKVQEYNKIKVELTTLNMERERLFSENEEIKKLSRVIIAKEEVFPNVLVVIDNSQLQVKQHYKRVIFYKTGIIIMGDYDQFMLRKRRDAYY